jgi:pantoate--beta-alanine ligase
MTMVVAHTRAELDTARDALGGRVAVVMTMGALHDGHLRLIDTARDVADAVLVTIFVNPLQFAQSEDLGRYPRDLDRDLALCESRGVAVVFAPSVEEMYPPGHSIPRIAAGELGGVLEGEVRPTHFEGVLTVVAELMRVTRPDVAVFGEKDAQQLELIRRMVVSEGLPVEVLGVATVREPDGLALSSRNAYLDVDQRGQALALSRALNAGRSAASDGPAAVVARTREVLAATPTLVVDYVALVDATTWQQPNDGIRLGRLLVAGRVGSTRLIDNVTVEFGAGA